MAGSEGLLAGILAWWGLSKHSALVVAVLLSVWALIIVKAVADRSDEKDNAARNKRQDAWLDERESIKRFKRRLFLDAASLAHELDVRVRRFSGKLHWAMQNKWQDPEGTIRIVQAWETYYDNEVFRRLARIHARSKKVGVEQKEIDDALFEGVDLSRARIVERALVRMMDQLETLSDY